MSIKKIASVILSVLMIIQIIPASVMVQAAETREENKEISGYSTNISQDEKEPEILNEDLSKRSVENIKYFNMSNGTTIAAVYDDAVQYQKEDGSWEDIDNTLFLSEKSFGFEGYETANNKLKVKFAKDTNQDRLIVYSLDNYVLEFSLKESYKKLGLIPSRLNQNKTKDTNEKTMRSNAYQTVCYKDALKDTDFEYVLSGSQIKENIIVKSPQEEYDYAFNVSVDNLLLTAEKDGSIAAVDINSKKQVLSLPSPFMIDAKGQISYDAEYHLTKLDNKQYEISIILNSEWMNDKTRSFPVIIDPGVVTEQTKRAIDSTFVVSGNPNHPYATEGASMIMVGKSSVSDIGKCQGLLKFETLPELSAGDVVIDAKLNAVQFNGDAYSSTTPDTALEVHAITSSWNKNTATWNTKPTYNSAVADFEVLKRTECNNTLRQRKWNVTSIVKQWYDGTLDNNGLLLRSSNENASTSNQSCIYAWICGENYSYSQSAYPALVITYRSNKGIEPYWSYTTLDAGEAGTAYICDYSGNLVFVHDDAQTHADFGTASVSHVFNNYMTGEIFGTRMPYRGHGWMMSCQQQVLPSSVFGLTGTALTTYPYVYIDGDGTEHYFYKKSDNTIVDEDGLGLTLTIPQTDNDKWYKITDDKNNVMWFNKGNALSSTVDSNGNQVTYNYQSSTDTRLVSITDAFNQQLTMTPVSNDKTIETITDAANRTKTFNWSNGTLNSIVTHNNRTTTFTYDSELSILSVTAPDGYKLEFEYTPASDGKRVKKVIESSGTTTGQTITFDYSKYGTTVMRSSGKDGIYGNSDDVFTTTKFDSAGRTVCSESDSAGKTLGASSTEFTAAKANSTASNIRQLNRVSKSAQAGKIVRNYLLDGNTETNNVWYNAQWNGTASFTSEIDSNTKLYGKYSRKISSTSVNEYAASRTCQTLSSGQFETNKTYTYSAWVKTSNVTAVSSAVSGAEIFATYWDADNHAFDFHSEQILGTTTETINNGWQKLSVTFTVPVGATQIRCNLAVRNSIGDAWFDGIQLEEGEVANPFNLLDNASFERYSSNFPTSWNGYNTDSNDLVNSSHKIDGSYGFRFASEPMTPKHISQDIYFSGSTANNDDSYVLSGWMWANPIEGDDYNNIGFCMTVYYSDGTTYQKYYDCNHSVKGWQYYATAFTLRDKDNPNAEKTPTRIRIYLIDHRQSNNTWFDNIQLVRDEAQSFTYDSDGNLISVTENAQQKSTMEYTNKDLTKSIDAKGYNYQYTYDSNHNMTKATSQTGVDYNYTYNTNGMPTSLTINNGNSEQIKTELVYTPNGKYVKQVKDQDGNIEQYTHNATRGLLTAYTDKNGNRIQYGYDSQTDLMNCVLESNLTASVLFYYNSDLRLNRINNNGTSYYFDYDAFGNTTQTRVGTQALSTNTYGTNNGELERVTYGNGVYKDYTYDDYGNIISESVNGTPQSEWQYDSFGNLYSYKDLANSRKILYNYDSTGRLIRQGTVNSSNRPIYTSEYGYDLNNNITRFSSSAGGVNLTESYTYGQDNLPSQYSVPSGKTVSYSFDNLNRLTGKTYNLTSPVSLSYEYASSERNTDSSIYTTTKISTETLGDDVYSYVYDANGNITEIYRQTVNDNEPVLIQYFYYDEVNRLISADDLVKNCTEEYDYDRAGNITSVIVYPYTPNSTTSGLTPLSTESYGYTDTNWKDKLTSYNNQAITYDEIGNPLSYKGYTLSWQNGRQLATLSGNGVTASYTYDCDGYRTSKTVNGVVHNYYYMGDRLQYEQFGNNKLWFLYDADGLPAGLRYDDGTTATYYYYVCNWRGDVVSLYSDTALVCKYDYDAWGNVTSVKDADGTSITSSTHIANINPIRYRGYYYDNETNLYYLASRYYDPQIRRFINADDILVLYDDFNSYNVFIYCSNNPTVSSDATGHLTFTWRYKYNPMNVKIAKNQKQPVDPKSPPPPSSGYVPPKSNKNPGKVPNPNGSGKGWPSKDGGVWIPNNKQHGGPGWTVQYPNGQHEHRYPDGHVRKANINYSQLKTAIELTIISIAIVGIVADDITGIGIADNDMLNTVIPLFHERWSEVIA